jgi:23S rRNA pseudouridine2457 synthase
MQGNGKAFEDSEGSPRMYEITYLRKEYYVQVDGIIDQEAIDKMKGGVEIGFNGTKYRTKSEASLIIEAPALGPEEKMDERHGPTSWASTVNEGKFRQIRKMTAAVDFHT